MSQVTLCSILVYQGGGTMKHVGEWRLSEEATAQFAAAVKANRSEFSAGVMSFVIELGHDDTFVLIAKDAATLAALQADAAHFHAA